MYMYVKSTERVRQKSKTNTDVTETLDSCIRVLCIAYRFKKSRYFLLFAAFAARYCRTWRLAGRPTLLKLDIVVTVELHWSKLWPAIIFQLKSHEVI